jgi:hypothetical protein
MRISSSQILMDVKDVGMLKNQSHLRMTGNTERETLKNMGRTQSSISIEMKKQTGQILSDKKEKYVQLLGTKAKPIVWPGSLFVYQSLYP